MRQSAEPGPLVDMIARHVDDFADRFALRAELKIHGPVPEIGARAQAEVLRIVQEAMTNVRKHADATVVRVDVTSNGELTAHRHRQWARIPAGERRDRRLRAGEHAPARCAHRRDG